MKSTVLWALVVLNAMLLMSFLSRVMHENTAIAQPAAGAARRGDYLMIPGEVPGGNSGVVYVVDASNNLLSALSYDESSRKIVTMQKIDLNQIFTRGAEGNPTPNNTPRRGGAGAGTGTGTGGTGGR